MSLAGYISWTDLEIHSGKGRQNTIQNCEQGNIEIDINRMCKKITFNNIISNVVDVSSN